MTDEAPSSRPFTPEELARIRGQSMSYLCACPGQLASMLEMALRVEAHEVDCLKDTDNDRRVHERIAGAVVDVRRILDSALNDVLALEGWDRDTLEMPEALQKRLAAQLARED